MPEVDTYRPPANLSDAATYANVSTRFIRREVERGHLPVVRIGRMLRFHLDDLDAYLAGHRVASRQTVSEPALPDGQDGATG